MKKTLSLFLIMNGSYAFLFSQQDSAAAPEKKSVEIPEKINISTRLPQKGNIGFTLNLIGFMDTISLGSFKDHIGNDFLLMRYYLENKSALRFGLGLNLNNENWSRVDSATTAAGAAQVMRDSSYKRTDFYFSPGYEMHFSSGKNLDPYLAAALQIGKIGRTKIHDKTTSTDTTGKSVNDYTFNMAGGYLAGINFMAGFNYFFSEKFSIGAEYGFGINSARYGGDWEEVLIVTPASGTKTVTRSVGSLSVNKTKFKMNSMAGVMLSYYF